MLAPWTIVERLPTVKGYVRLIAAVGFRPCPHEAIALALKHSWFAVCAGDAGEAIGRGRVIGDGGLHLYLTDVIVHPACQRRGVGTAIVGALAAWVDAASFPNTVVGLIATPGLVRFYQRHGYTPQPSGSLAMMTLVNPQTDVGGCDPGVGYPSGGRLAPNSATVFSPLSMHQEAIMATNDERNAAHLLTLLEHAPGRQLSSEQVAEQTGWSPEELSAAVGLLRSRQQVVLDDASLGSGNYGFTSIMLPP
jgi:GNAT superfamily N-acetyltransferase